MLPDRASFCWKQIEVPPLPPPRISWPGSWDLYKSSSHPVTCKFAYRYCCQISKYPSANVALRQPHPNIVLIESEPRDKLRKYPSICYCPFLEIGLVPGNLPTLSVLTSCATYSDAVMKGRSVAVTKWCSDAVMQCRSVAVMQCRSDAVSQ